MKSLMLSLSLLLTRVCALELGPRFQQHQQQQPGNASAQHRQHYHVNTTACDFASMKPGATCKIEWSSLRNSLHPAQHSVGYAWIQRKLDKDFTSKSKAQSSMDDDWIPFVLGPGDVPWMVDGHHTALALEKSGYSSTMVTLVKVCDWAQFSFAEFERKMVEVGFAYVLTRPSNQPNALPEPVGLDSIPPTIVQLTDDPWRALAGFARKIELPACKSSNKYCLRAYERPCMTGGKPLPFFEFRWAYFLNVAYTDDSLWPSASDAQAFRSRYNALPPSQIGKVDVQEWITATETLQVLCRGARAGSYLLPNYDAFEGVLPGYVSGVTTQIPQPDPDCPPPTCPD